ncbi:MAG: hypothetical protein IKQ91_06045 [Oscillospiraceae bacterium]|nr:hypothetical protein [Oscillospiraceae bacterium]
MDWNEQIADMMKKLGMSPFAVDSVMKDNAVDFNELAAEAEAQGSTDPEENPALGDIFGQLNQLSDQFASRLSAQGGIMPDDIESIAEQFSALGGMEGMNDVFEKMSEAFGMEYDEIDLDEEVAAYDPAAEDAADRKFVAALKEFIKASAAEIPEDDVCAFEIGYHTDFTDETLETPVYNLWLSYNTEKTNAENEEKYGEEVWNWINWTEETFRTMDDAPFAAWREAQGFDEDNDGDEMIDRIYDLAVVAVMELHKEKFTEQRFGRKIPFVIEDYEYYQKTAIRAVKANGGKELFDKAFFAECGFEDDEEDAE